MLTHIHIRNFAIIDEVELELGDGLTVLTGETGAGKSIVVDALGLVLGDRADAGAVRHGEARAEITLGIDTRGLPALRAWLAEQMIDEDDECLVRRVISAEGRSRAFINGQQVPLASLRTLGELVVDIHGQHEHQSLMKPEVQRRLLDHHGGLDALADQTAEAHGRWQAAREALSAASDSVGERAARLDLLRYQLGELAALDLKAGEVEALEAEHLRLSHGERLVDGALGAVAALYEDEASAHQLMARQLRLLDALVELDPALAPARDLLRDAEIQLSEAAEQLRRYGDDVDNDPQRSQWVEQRLSSVRELARKHRVAEDALHELQSQLGRELEELDGLEARLEALEQAESQAQKHYFQLAERLSAGREKAAASLAGQVSTLMQELGMPGGRLDVVITRLPRERARASGIDQVELQVAANPGQPPRALTKVASGGELSRISLAIQVIAADAGSTPCMVFDEVDAGIGGGVAEIVGRKLRELGERRQVLCVTHVPQVASLGHRHMRVSKLTDASSTRTLIDALEVDEKVEELARMLGGVKITERTRAHAAEMLARAESG
ncbi:MAG: DNA repair protein RecN [Gammaproteobacteria bacterium]|nr:DNA repair protein RecN [Gammaproteobacteria bacterium]